MVFSSVTFLFFFLPAVLIAYYINRSRGWRNGVLTLFSLFFYSWGGLQGLTVMLASIFINWLFALLIDRYRDKKTLAKLLLFTMVALNLGIIGYYKYAAFFVNSFLGLFGIPDALEKVLMPIGISFFTFQAMSYVVDVYRGSEIAQKNIAHVALYISMFPPLVAGPIIRYQTVADAIESRSETLDDFVRGVRRFIYGLSKKLLLANAMGQIAGDIFAFSANELSVLGTWVGALAYTLQIYLDFSAYSDMSIGLGLMLGFHFDENFNYPYISKSITEFWRRWHISLSSWFRDYVYFPLGGSRVSFKKHIRNIMVVWFLTGLWHGAQWTFVAWGVYYGVLLIVEKYSRPLLDRLYTPLRHAITMLIVVVGWVIFRSDSLTYAWDYLKGMFGMGSLALVSNQAIYYIIYSKWVWVACIIAALPLKNPVNRFLARIEALGGRLWLATRCAMGAWELFILALAIIEVVNTTFNPFIYFRF